MMTSRRLGDRAAVQPPHLHRSGGTRTSDRAGQRADNVVSDILPQSSAAAGTRPASQNHKLPRACLPSSGVVVGDAGGMSRFALLSDEQWARVEPLLPSSVGKKSRPFRDHRQVVEGIVYRYRTGIAWRDLPREQFGPWQTVWKRHRRFAGDGTWDKVLTALQAQADAVGDLDWTVSADSTINRAHQHATNTKRPEGATGGSVESQASRGQKQ